MSQLPSWLTTLIISGETCWGWKGSISKEGYPRITRKYETKGVTLKVSRIIYSILYGDIPPGHVIRHSCDNPGCVNPDHLLLGTPKQNSQDAVNRLRHAWGVRNSKAKLSPTQILEIRDSRLSVGELSKKYSISKSQIGRIKAHESWSKLVGGVKQERISSRKLTRKQVEEIRSDPRKLKLIATDFGVNISSISRIKSGTRWKNT